MEGEQLPVVRTVADPCRWWQVQATGCQCPADERRAQGIQGTDAGMGSLPCASREAIRGWHKVRRLPSQLDRREFLRASGCDTPECRDGRWILPNRTGGMHASRTVQAT